MPCKETRKSHTCFAKNNTKARWLKICQTMLKEPISVHIKSTWTYRHPRKSWRSDQGIVCHVNLLFKITKEKGVFYIHLTKRSTLLSSNRNNSPNCNHLSDQSKSLLIVHLIFLSDTKSNQPCFISIQSPIRMEFDRANPLTTNNFNNQWARNILGMIIFKSAKLVYHDLPPTFKLSCLRITCRNCNRWQSSMKGCRRKTIRITRTRKSSRTARNRAKT